MNELVSNVLASRGRDPDGLRRMMIVSAVAHAALVLALVVAPESWRRVDAAEERTVMTISLGGAPGPQAGGMTPLGGRPIQEAAPAPETPRPEPVRPPAAQAPQMTMPAEQSRPRPTPQPPAAPRTTPPEARGTTPTRGPETRAGSAVAETGGQGVGFGLTTGGGGGTGSYLDVGDFCCPEYLATMLDLIRRNWNNRQEVPGEALVRFTIQRDGRLTDVALHQSSGYAALDLASQRAVLVTQQVPPLPAEFTPNQLTVYLNFQYQR